MKISIITTCYNSQNTIKETIESVLSQDYNKLEYIIVDGGSTDNTLEIIDCYIDKIDILISGPDKGIYDAMNIGINRASGDLIGILNSDDIYAKNTVITEVINLYKKNPCNIIFGDLVYFSNNNPKKIIRTYSSGKFRPWKLRFGWMPPHPATFFHKSIFQEHGLYSLDYRTGADYEMFVRLLLKLKLPYFYINNTLIKMRNGGATTSGIKSIINTSKEMVKSLNSNGFYANHFLIYLRLPIKFFERFHLYK